MKMIVWVFGDGTTQYTALDPMYRRPVAGGLRLETEAEQLERMRREYPAKLAPTNMRVDHTMRNDEEQAVYVASLGDGAVARFAGLIDADEYRHKCDRLRAFREAWTWTTDEPVIEIDMVLAVEAKKRELRKARAPLLASLDIEMQRAIESGDAARIAAVGRRKQALRDITADPALAAASTPEALLAVTPAALVG